MADAPRLPAEYDSTSSHPSSVDAGAAEMQRFMQQVYAWMAGALALSGAVAYYVSTDLTLVMWIFEK